MLKEKLNLIGKIITIFLPWPIKRVVLIRCFGYQISPSAHIGISWIFPSKLIMHERSVIKSLTVALHLDLIELLEDSLVERSNWITGFPSGSSSKHFKHQIGRCSSLRLGESAAIAKQHHLDCTNSITIGKYSIIAGYSSQLLTHSIDLQANRQDSSPITIGDYCFVGTGCILLGGAVLPSYSVLAAMSLLNKAMSEEWSVYAGQPASKIKEINQASGFFSRTIGFVD